MMPKIIKIAFYLITALFAVWGTIDAWTLREPRDLTYFTTQSNIFLAALYLWSAAAALTGKTKPAASLKTASLLYILITGLVSNLILDFSDFYETPEFLGLSTLDMVHAVTPALAFIVFIVFENHKTLKIRHAAFWLLYPPAYFIFILTINAINPEIGYPYPFIDLNVLTAGQLSLNIVIYSTAFYLLGLLLVGLDRILPEKALIH